MTNYDGLFDKEYFGDKLNEDHFSRKKLSCQIIKNGIVLPYLEDGENLFGGVVTDKGKYTDGTNVLISDNSNTVIYMGTLSNIWGHCLTDDFKRLWFLKSDSYKKNFSDCPIVCTYRQKTFPENFLKLIKILEIDFEKFQFIDKPIKFKKIVIPDESFFLSKSKRPLGKDKLIIDGSLDNFKGNECSFFTKEYVEIIDRIRHYALKNYSPMSQKKFYFSHGKSQIGEEELADYFHTKGYEIIHPENLPIEEQLNILLNCENFASAVGSISHNIIFMRDNSNVILIPRRASYVNIYQQALNQMRDLDIYYIDSALSIFAKYWGGPFCYIISKNLRKHFGDDTTEEFSDSDIDKFMAYSKFARHVNMGTVNPNEEKYLKNILPNLMKRIRERMPFLRKN